MSEWLADVLAKAEKLEASGDRRLTPDRDFGSYLEVQERETERRRQAFTGEKPNPTLNPGEADWKAYQERKRFEEKRSLEDNLVTGDNPGPRISQWMPKWPPAISRDDEEWVVPLPSHWKPLTWDEEHRWERGMLRNFVPFDRRRLALFGQPRTFDLPPATDRPLLAPGLPGAFEQWQQALLMANPAVCTVGFECEVPYHIALAILPRIETPELLSKEITSNPSGFHISAKGTLGWGRTVTPQLLPFVKRATGSWSFQLDMHRPRWNP